MALTLERLKQLVARNAPVLYLQPTDVFMPCSVEFFMEHSELCTLTEQVQASRR